MSFRDTIVAKLGAQHAPFDWIDALLTGAALATVIGLEWLFGRSIRRMIAGAAKHIAPNRNSTTPDVFAQMPLLKIETVRFYKRGQVTTDLICCDVEAHGRVWTFHEEASGWGNLIAYLSELPGFQTDWYSRVATPPFAASETVAFRRR